MIRSPVACVVEAGPRLASCHGLEEVATFARTWARQEICPRSGERGYPKRSRDDALAEIYVIERPMTNPHHLPAERKAIYYAGMALAILGTLMFLSTFIRLMANFGNFDPGFTQRVPAQFLFSFCGMILIVAGKLMMRVGVRGLSGSGIILDPEQTRHDLEPWSRMTGGMIQDALSEVDFAQDAPMAVPAAEVVVKVRCQKCSSLNDEHAKFCDQCGQPI